MSFFSRIMFPGILTFGAFVSLTAFGGEARTKKLLSLCAQCHGQQLEGNFEVGAPAISGMPAWYVEAQVTKMRNDVRGKHPKDIGGMKMRPLMRSLRDEADIKAVTALIESMPKSQPALTVTGDAAKGEARYALCTSCHGENAQGIKELNAPPLTITDDWYLLTQLKHFKNKVRAGNAAADPIGAQMASIAVTLEDEQVMKDLLAYINTKR
jgi:cytochrome c oxidase subunit 2